MNDFTLVKATAARDLTPDQVREHLVSMVDAGLDLRRVAVETGIAVYALQALATGDLREPVCRKAGRWIREQQDAAANLDPGFVETPSAKKMIRALEIARNEPSIALIHGGVGIGKTEAAKHYFWKTNGGHALNHDLNSIFVSLISSPTTSSTLLKMVSGNKESTDHSISLMGTIRESLGDAPLIIIDEAQFLSADAKHTARAFYDQLKCGVALLGNDEFITELRGSKKMRGFPEILSRAGIGADVHIPVPTEQDIDSILLAWGVTGSKERAEAIEIGTSRGGLRRLVKVLKASKPLAEGASGITVKIMKSVAALATRI